MRGPGEPAGGKAVRPVAEPLYVRTVEIDDPGFLLDRIPADGALSWVRDGDGLVGWGEAARVELDGAERFSRAQRWWTDLLARTETDDQVAVPGTGPIAFASFGFDPRPGRSVVVVPRTVLGRRGGRAWLTTVGTGTPAPAARLRPVAAPTPVGTVQWEAGRLDDAAWQAAVSQAVARIRSGELDKVVLARDILARVSGPIDVRRLLRRLALAYPDCWTFAVDGLVGATPELLVRRTGDHVTSRVLAGTVRRDGDASADASAAQALLASGKDLHEHEYAVHSVADALAAHCTDLDVPDRPTVLRLANVQHLVTDVTGRLADAVPVLALAGSLHPTAAVCGTPTERAMAVIRELEGIDRGRYAGPVGWFDANGDGELGIALRCAEVDAAAGTLRLFAGCGIVAGSQPAAELAETRDKLRAMQTAVEPD
ncbi:MAG: isochorismate synthase [Actinomycetota bacterium]|nr:MAG: isochorismate synthase [Actinomycetota bacterium]